MAAHAPRVNKQTDKQTDYYNPWPPTRLGLTNKQTDKQTDYYNPWPPTRLGLITIVFNTREDVHVQQLHTISTTTHTHTKHASVQSLSNHARAHEK